MFCLGIFFILEAFYLCIIVSDFVFYGFCVCMCVFLVLFLLLVLSCFGWVFEVSYLLSKEKEGMELEEREVGESER